MRNPSRIFVVNVQWPIFDIKSWLFPYLGLNVTCTAVERPDVNIKGTREIAYSLGATNFETYSYHP